MKTIQEFDVNQKTVFLRSEFNVALDRDYKVVDDSRIRASLPTIHWLLEHKARIVICSHLGRPWGERDESKSLRHLLTPLSDLLGVPVTFAPDCIGPERDNLVSALSPGDVLLLENVRYYKQENDNDPEFSKALAHGIDIYVNDAFGTSHRSHASMIGVPAYVQHKAAGLLVAQEICISFMLNYL